MTFTITPRAKGHGVTLASEVLSYPMWYGNAADAAGYAKFRAGSARAIIQIFDTGGTLVETINHDPLVIRENAGQLGAL